MAWKANHIQAAFFSFYHFLLKKIFLFQTVKTKKRKLIEKNSSLHF